MGRVAQRVHGLVTGAVLAVALLAGCAGGAAPPPAQPPASSAPTGTPTTPGPASAPAALPDVPVRDARAGARAPAPSPPVRVVYDGLGLDMPVLPVGVAEDGQMEVPEDAAQAGWYRFGPTPGADRGSAVLAAHSGSYITPRGPFHELEDSARPGDRVEVVLEDGTAVAYEVREVENIGKSSIDMEPYFRRGDEHGLVLITCGGRWDPARSSYDDNVVVTAAPLDR